MVTVEARPAGAGLARLPLVLRFPEGCALTDELLLGLSALNGSWRFERDAEGALVMNFAAGGESSEAESEIGMQLRVWWRGHRSGRVYSSSGGIRRADGSVRMPDAAWVSAERLGQPTRGERRGLLTAAPDFVVEVRSPSQGLEEQQGKLEEWMAFGVRLGVLVDPDDRLVFVYRPGRAVERLVRPSAWSAEPELAGFVIDFDEVWALIGEDD